MVLVLWSLGEVYRKDGTSSLPRKVSSKSGEGLLDLGFGDNVGIEGEVYVASPRRLMFCQSASGGDSTVEVAPTETINAKKTDGTKAMRNTRIGF